MPLAEELKRIVRGEVIDTPDMRKQYARDASIFTITPEVVIFPKDAQDVSALVEYVAQQKKDPRRAHISITARGAGTDMSGGPLTDSIALDMTKHCNRFLGLSHDIASVEPGMFFRDFDIRTKRDDLELPSYTASRELNTVGGMVANNSGGEKNLKYGKTARYVEALDVVLSDGKLHTLRLLQGEALQQKLAEQSFEGEIHRRVAALLTTHQKVIEMHKPQVEKNSSGYALWDMGDGVHSLNLARLMVGAQGTLGIITKADIRLVHPKPYASMVVIFLKHLSELGAVVPQVLAHQPDSFESYDDHTFALGVKYFPEFTRSMKTNIFSLLISFLPEFWMLLTGGIPKLVLLVEFRAATQEEAEHRAEQLAVELKETKDISVRIAPSERQARKYWAIRRESFNLLRKKVHGMRTVPFIDDFVVPPDRLAEFLPKLEAILSHYHLTYTVAGHVGDGNFHIIPLAKPSEPGLPRIIDELSHQVYNLVLSYHGSITGEHNDGLVRTPYVEKMFGQEMYALFYEIKKIFDPLNIFNPGKKVGLTYSDAFAHLDLPKSSYTPTPEAP